MAHPFQRHREHHVERERVQHITGHHEGHRDHEHVYHRARGGEVSHHDEVEDRAMIRRMVKPGSLKAHGHHSHQRADKRARGGKVKHKGKTVVNVNVAPQQSAPHPMPMPGPGPAAAAPPPAPPRPPMPMPPPGSAPPMMGPRAMGGRTYKTGGAVEPHFKAGVGMGPTGKGVAGGKKVTTPRNAIYSPAKGSMGPTSGTGTGGAVARMELSHRAAKNYHKTPPAIHTPGMRND